MFSAVTWSLPSLARPRSLEPSLRFHCIRPIAMITKEGTVSDLHDKSASFMSVVLEYVLLTITYWVDVVAIEDE